MRIVGGSLSGRRIPGRPPKGTRPTSDRVREAIASALVSRGLIDGARVLDLYAGTGALSFEALSRGARFADLVDRSKPAVSGIRAAAAALGLSERVAVHRLDLSKAEGLDRLEEPAELVFLDPPYADVAQCATVLARLWSAGKLAPGAAIVIEHARGATFALPAGFTEQTRYRYGDTGVLLAEAPIGESA